MSGRLAYQLDALDDVVDLRLDGVLDLCGAALLRTVLYKLLAEAPAAILVNLVRLRVEDDMCLTLFPAVARQAGTVPATAFVVYGATDVTRARMSALGIDQYVSSVPSRDEAIRSIRRNQLTARVSQRYAAVSESVPAARLLAKTACLGWEIPSVVSQRIGVVVTELAANAVRHARTPFEVVLRRSRQFVHVSVLDGDERLAQLTGPASATSAGGRGLILVEAYAASWGSYPTTRGKSTWATVRFSPLRTVSPSS